MKTPAHRDPPEASPASPFEVDAELLAVARRGDAETAARLLVTAHGGAVGRACMALLGSQSEAESALRDTLAEALAALPTLSGQSRLRGWLLGIARRRCARRSVASPTLAATTGRADAAPRARRLLAELRPTEREALVLRFALELTWSEVGEACGVDEAAARKRASQGLSRLRGLMSEDQ